MGKNAKKTARKQRKLQAKKKKKAAKKQILVPGSAPTTTTHGPSRESSEHQPRKGQAIPAKTSPATSCNNVANRETDALPPALTDMVPFKKVGGTPITLTPLKHYIGSPRWDRSMVNTAKSPLDRVVLTHAARDNSNGQGSNPNDGQGNNPTDDQENNLHDGQGSNPTDGQGSNPTDGQENNPNGGQENNPTDGQENNPNGGQEHNSTNVTKQNGQTKYTKPVSDMSKSTKAIASLPYCKTPLKSDIGEHAMRTPVNRLEQNPMESTGKPSPFVIDPAFDGLIADCIADIEKLLLIPPTPVHAPAKTLSEIAQTIDTSSDAPANKATWADKVKASIVETTCVTPRRRMPRCLRRSSLLPASTSKTPLKPFVARQKRKYVKRIHRAGPLRVVTLAHPAFTLDDLRLLSRRGWEHRVHRLLHHRFPRHQQTKPERDMLDVKREFVEAVRQCIPERLCPRGDTCDVPFCTHPHAHGPNSSFAKASWKAMSILLFSHGTDRGYLSKRFIYLLERRFLASSRPPEEYLEEIRFLSGVLLQPPELNMNDISRWHIMRKDRGGASLLDFLFRIYAQHFLPYTTAASFCGKMNGCIWTFCRQLHHTPTLRDQTWGFKWSLRLLFLEAQKIKGLVEMDEIQPYIRFLSKTIKAPQDRISILMKIASLLVIAQDRHLQPLVKLALNDMRITHDTVERKDEYASPTADVELTSTHLWNNLDPSKALEKALEWLGSEQSMRTYDVTKTQLGIGARKAESLFKLWRQCRPEHDTIELEQLEDGRMTIAMLVYLFLTYDDQAILSHFAKEQIHTFFDPPRKREKFTQDMIDSARTKRLEKVSNIRDCLAERIVDLGLIEEFMKSSETELTTVCVSLFVDLSAVFGLMVQQRNDRPGPMDRNSPLLDDMDYWSTTEDDSDDELCHNGRQTSQTLTTPQNTIKMEDWRALLRPLIDYEYKMANDSITGGFLCFLLCTSNQLSHQRRDMANARMFLTSVAHVLHTWLHVRLKGDGTDAANKIPLLSWQPPDALNRVGWMSSTEVDVFRQALDKLYQKVTKTIPHDCHYYNILSKAQTTK